MSLHSTLLTTWLLGIGLLVAPPSIAGQTPASDSAAKAASDSQSARTDSVPKADTARATSDSSQSSDSTLRAGTPIGTAKSTATPRQPEDSILKSACGGWERPVSVARDLLVIVFASEATAEERAAVAKSVEGKLLGPVSAEEPGAYYLRVPSGGDEYRLRAATDRLILLPQVRQVGSRACPRHSPS